MHFSVLNKKQAELLKKLSFLKEYGFYLAGGTALALQIAHRTSLDFDFYTPQKFDPQKIKKEFDKRFKNVKEIYLSEDTLILNVEGTIVSCFWFPYKLIRPCQDFKEVSLASLEDIGAMKMIAISQRGKRRDFIDLYFLLKKFGLRKIIEFVKKKYPNFNIYVGLQGLLYFEDAEKDPEKERFRLLKKVKWSEIKKFIIEEVKKFKKYEFKKQKK